MPVEPKLLLESAEDLAKGDSELDWRSAAHRAYYAAHHRCIPLGRLSGFDETGGSVHRNLIDTLTGTGDRTLMSIGYMLEQCRGLRVKADYRIELDFPQADAATVVRQCKRIFEKAESATPKPAE